MCNLVIVICDLFLNLGSLASFTTSAINFPENHSLPQVLNFLMWLMVSNCPYSLIGSTAIFVPLVFYQTPLYHRTLINTHVI